MTKKQIASIARATKKCRPDGMGLSVTVWADGDYSEYASRNEAVARNTPNGIEGRLCAISHPVSIAGATEIIGQAIEVRERAAMWEQEVAAQ
jgi:hypothetical protein